MIRQAQDWCSASLARSMNVLGCFDFVRFALRSAVQLRRFEFLELVVLLSSWRAHVDDVHSEAAEVAAVDAVHERHDTREIDDNDQLARNESRLDKCECLRSSTQHRPSEALH